MTSEDVSSADDARMVEALRRGDESAFAELVERHHTSLQRVALLYVRDVAVAEEVAQETWLAVLKGIHAFEGRSSLKTWIFHILPNRARTRGEQGARSLTFSALDRPDEPSEAALDRLQLDASGEPRGQGGTRGSGRATSPESALLSQEVTDRVMDAVEALPPAQRVVLTLRDIEGWTSEDVCALLDISEANQRVLLHRARAQVRKVLETDERP